MRETELRIQKYKAMLPRARERVIAALKIFAFSLAMLTVSTFSWITLSIAPEVSGVTTTIAANGNLEIALAGRYDSNGNLLEPAPTQIGDGSLLAAERNITWGNLINLSDPSYALERIVLRPAALNKNSLLTAPLYAAKYNAEGRVVDYDDDFALTKWDGSSGFVKSETKGINAISSVLYETVDYEDPNAQTYKDLAANATLLLRNAAIDFKAMDSKMSPIGGLIETFMSGQLKESSTNPNALTNEVCDPDDVLGFYELMVYMYDVPMESLGEALIDILYMYQVNTSALTNSEKESVYPNPVKFTSVDAFCEGAEAELAAISAARSNAAEKSENFVQNITTELFSSDNFKNTIVKTIKQYIAHREHLERDIATFEAENGIKERAEKAKMGDGSITWGDISTIIQGLVDISTCEIGGWTVDKLAGTGDGMKAAISMVTGGDTQEAVIKDGLIVDIEAMLHDGNGIRVSNLEVKISKDALTAKLESAGYGDLTFALNIVNPGKDYVSVTANVTTYATAKFPTATAYLDIEKANEIVGTPLKSSNYFAQDTYGLSVDFWLRTNAPSTYLILEGEVVYDNNPITAVINTTDADGNAVTETVNVYLATVKRTVVTVTGEGETAETDTQENYFTEQQIYSKTEKNDNNEDVTVWYYVSNSQPVVITNEVNEYTDEDTGIKYTVTTNAVIEGTPEQYLSKNVIGYSGANRIWNDETYLGDTYNADYSTSQGTGSCYTFYLDDPSNENKYLTLLDALRVVFHDADGQYLATAKLDTTLSYSDHGKVTVPLVIMEENSTIYATVDDGNDTLKIPAITTLTKGNAELITALVYLDGALVDNTQVLDSSEIQGKLNIQFGSTYVPNNALENDELRDEEIRVTGDIEGTKEFNYDPDSPRTVKVKVTIDGNTPKIVTGNFVRVINNVQGTLYKSVMFTKTSEEGVWEATVEFDAPGEFLMRSVFIDGIEYEFEKANADEADKVKVTINGFALTSFASVGGLGSSAYHITADSSVSEEFVLKLASDAYVPSSVKAVFVNEDNIYVTVTFDSNISDITEWTGTANFIYSGTYRLTNVVIDTNYYPLPNNVTYTRYVSTGLRANVNVKISDEYLADENLALTNGNIAYLFRGESHVFDVIASVADGSGNSLGYVGDRIQVNYTNNLKSDLYWNGEEYVGEFLVETPGEFKFSNIYLNTYAQSITSSSSADSITCIPTDPVEYLGIVDAVPESVVTAGGNEDNGNIITMRFKNAQASTLYGLFEKRMSENGTPEYVVLAANRTTVGAESDNTNDFTFNITEDGYWKLVETKLSLVYDDTEDKFYLGDGKLSVDEHNNVIFKDSEGNPVDTEEEGFSVESAFDAAGNYYTFDEELPDDYTQTKVVAKFTVTPTISNKQFDGAFMQTHDVTLGLKVTDFANEVIALDSATWMLIKDAGTALEYGGYTYSGDTTPNVIVNDSNKTMTLTNGIGALTATLEIAGSYTSNISYTLDIDGDGAIAENEQFTVKMDDKIIVQSVKPNVTVTGVSNQDTEINTKLTWKQKTGTGYKRLDYTFSETRKNQIDGFEVTVYAKASEDGESCGTGDAGFTRPTLKFKASGVSESATVKFTIPKGDASAINVTLNGTAESSEIKLGSINQVYSLDGYRAWVISVTYTAFGYQGHGNEAKIETITITQDGVVYTVTLDNPIVINNPSSIPTAG